MIVTNTTCLTWQQSCKSHRLDDLLRISNPPDDSWQSYKNRSLENTDGMLQSLILSSLCFGQVSFRRKRNLCFSCVYFEPLVKSSTSAVFCHLPICNMEAALKTLLQRCFTASWVIVVICSRLPITSPLLLREYELYFGSSSTAVSKQRQAKGPRITWIFSKGHMILG